MSWYVYLIECQNGSIYTGIAIDVEARFRTHAAGKGARYTRANPPLRLLASLPEPDRAAASRTEHRIKQLSPVAKRELAAASGLAHQSECSSNMTAAVNPPEKNL